MKKAYRYLPLLIFFISSFSMMVSDPVTPASETRQLYHSMLAGFEKETAILQEMGKQPSEKILQVQFLKTRLAYKRAELFIEYFFPFYAGKLNGPPIPFFEESEPDRGEQAPAGMQLIESYLFPKLDRSHMKDLQFQLSELNRYAIELPTINESFEFNDEHIFDATMEQLFRVSALGIAGFDAQQSGNAIPELEASLQGIAGFLPFYKKDFDRSSPAVFSRFEQLIAKAIDYSKSHHDFNGFDRMEFITQYLDPMARLLGRYKLSKGYVDNESGRYYSAVRKTGSLFDSTAFDPYRFLDDFTSSPARIALGKKLFFEPGLSSNKQRSCASCHLPGKAFTDGLKTSVALDGHSPLPRNAPTIWNAALQRNLFLDSRSRNLEDQVMQVLNNAKEMHGSAKDVAPLIVRDKAYSALYQSAYPNSRQEDIAMNICNAIACYERTLVSLNSRFDRHMRGQKALSQQEINGFNLFMGKAKCGTCHFMPLFGAAKPPRFYYAESEVLGIPSTTDKKHAKLDTDSGRYLVTNVPAHLYSFKTPSLRNVALTAPYMHNGVFASLEQVVDFYNQGGGKGWGIAPPNQSLSFDRLGLTKKEKKDIIRFMKSLTDTSGAY